MFRKYAEQITVPEPHPAAINQISTMTLTVEGLMEQLHISRPTAYALVKQEGFPAFNVGNRILINRKGLQEWIDRQSA